jgi:hypothetical protein
MVSKEELRKRYDTILRHFSFKDFLGLSALIFGLLMSNTSFETPTTQQSEVERDKPKLQRNKNEASKTSKEAKSKTPKKKALKVPRKERWSITTHNTNYWMVISTSSRLAGMI